MQHSLCKTVTSKIKEVPQKHKTTEKEMQQYFSGMQSATERKKFMAADFLAWKVIHPFWAHWMFPIWERLFPFSFSPGKSSESVAVDSNTEQVICCRHHHNLFSLSVCTISSAFCRLNKYQPWNQSVHLQSYKEESCVIYEGYLLPKEHICLVFCSP